MNVALIVFAGKGARINSTVPKQFIKINDKELVVYTIEAFNKHPLIDQIILVTSTEYLGYVRNMVLLNRLNKVVSIVSGGSTRQESVRNGLNASKIKDDDVVLIHDGDRPFVSIRLITKCIDEVRNGGIAPYIKHEDALKDVSNSGRFYFEDGVRYDIQTPQTFIYRDIKEAHNRLKDEEVSDDISLLEKLDMKVKYIPGEKENFKVTTNQDLKVAKERIVNFKDE